MVLGAGKARPRSVPALRLPPSPKLQVTSLASWTKKPFWPGGQAFAGRAGGTMITPAWLIVTGGGATMTLPGMGTRVTSEPPAGTDTPGAPGAGASVRLVLDAFVPAES